MFSYPCIQRPFRGPVEYCHTVWYRKSGWCGYQTVKEMDMFSRFDRIAVCDGQTDRHLATA